MSADRHALIAVLDYAAKLEQENNLLRGEIEQLKPKAKRVERLIVNNKTSIEADASVMADLLKHVEERGICKDFDGQKSTFNPTAVPAFAAGVKESVPIGKAHSLLEPFFAWVDGKLRKCDLLAAHGNMLKVATIDDPSKHTMVIIKPSDVHENDHERVTYFLNHYPG